MNRRDPIHLTFTADLLAERAQARADHIADRDRDDTDLWERARAAQAARRDIDKTWREQA